MIRLPNRTSQAGTYKTGTPNYVDVSTGAAAAGMRTFDAASTDWDDGDALGALVVKDDSNWQVWIAAWNGTSDRVDLASLEDSAGTLTDDDAVTVTATVTTAVLDSWRAENQRERLTDARTYYVATTGNDSNDGLTSGAPFATIQKAVDVVCSLDLSIYQATIQLADGTYTAGATLNPYVGALTPIIQGNSSTPGNVIISTDATAMLLTAPVPWSVKNFKITTSAGAGIAASVPGAVIDLAGIEFGACATQHIEATDGALITISGAYSITGNAGNHLVAGRLGSVRCFGGFTVSVSAAFSIFALATQLGSIRYSNITFSGSATGARYSAVLNSVISTNGGGASYLPGNAAGSTATGGQYA